MVAHKETDNFDSKFYKTADAFFPAYSGIGLTFDDITLATLYSEILPRETQLDTELADGLRLHIPIISSDMDTVTESRMAIAMALNGGLGLIHYNMPERLQLSEVSRVKHHVHGLIQEPIKIGPDQLIGDVLELIEQRKFGFSTFPVRAKKENWSVSCPATSLNRVTPKRKSPTRYNLAHKSKRLIKKNWARTPSRVPTSFSPSTSASINYWSHHASFAAVNIERCGTHHARATRNA